jgi:5-hydroxyisourate hydrolase
MSRISTHVLDTARGKPAAGIAVVLESAAPDGTWSESGRGVTDTDGRIPDLCPSGALGQGDCRLRFATGEYFRALGEAAFYPEVIVRVRLDPAAARYHLPLLLSPFGYSTYRGS